MRHNYISLFWISVIFLENIKYPNLAFSENNLSFTSLIEHKLHSTKNAFYFLIGYYNKSCKQNNRFNIDACFLLLWLYQSLSILIVSLKLHSNSKPMTKITSITTCNYCFKPKNFNIYVLIGFQNPVSNGIFLSICEF